MGAVEIFLKQVLMFVINLKADGKILADRADFTNS